MSMNGLEVYSRGLRGQREPPRHGRFSPFHASKPAQAQAGKGRPNSSLSLDTLTTGSQSTSPRRQDCTPAPLALLSYSPC